MALYFNDTKVPTVENDSKYNEAELKEVVYEGTTVWIKEEAGQFPNWGLTWSGNLILPAPTADGGTAEEQYSGMTALADPAKYWIQADAQAGALYASTGEDYGESFAELYASKSGSSNNLPWTLNKDVGFGSIFSSRLDLPYVSGNICWQAAELPPALYAYGIYFIPYLRVTNIYLKNK